MKTDKRKFNVICHLPNTKQGQEDLSNRIVEIYTEAIINRLNRQTLPTRHSAEIIQEILQSYHS